MRCDGDYTAYADEALMAERVRMAGQDRIPEQGTDDGDFVRRAAAIFAAELFKPMVQRAAVAPHEVMAVMAEIREKLDALDTVIAACDVPGVGVGVGLGVGHQAAASAARGSTAVAFRLLGPANGPPEPEPRDGLDDVGRNQRSRLRELAVLEALAREARPFALQQLTSVLDARGFADTSGAIVSQLHRLKKLGIIHQPANGMYEITDEGLGHMRRLRSSFGALLSGN